IRSLPDGRPLQIIVESAGEGTEETDVLRLIADSWERVGIKLFVKVEQREVFRNRVFSGDEMMAVWWGLENGVPNDDSSPAELAPTSQQYLEWPKWGQYYETRGRAGEAVDMPTAERLMSLYRDWQGADREEDKDRIWHEMLAIHAHQLFTIGTIAGVPQPVVVSNRLRNRPAERLYSWEPGGAF